MSVRTRAAAAVTVLATAAAVSVALAPQAGAASDPTLRVSYDVVGTTHIAKPNSDVNLGPSVLRSILRPSGDFTAGLKLPPTTSSFNILGLLPVTADVKFVPAGRVTGVVASAAGGVTVSSVAKFYINLNNVKVAGIPTFVGSSCQTLDPVVISVSGPFQILSGGTLTGTYSIGQFANCGLTTALVNQLVPGDGNTASLTLSNARLTRG